MLDGKFLYIAAAVATAVAVILTLLDKLYSVFIIDVSPATAMILASMGLLHFAVIVLAIYNRIEINNSGSEKS